MNDALAAVLTHAQRVSSARPGLNVSADCVQSAKANMLSAIKCAINEPTEYNIDYACASLIVYFRYFETRSIYIRNIIMKLHNTNTTWVDIAQMLNFDTRYINEYTATYDRICASTSDMDIKMCNENAERAKHDGFKYDLQAELRDMKSQASITAATAIGLTITGREDNFEINHPIYRSIRSYAAFKLKSLITGDDMIVSDAHRINFFDKLDTVLNTIMSMAVTDCVDSARVDSVHADTEYTMVKYNMKKLITHEMIDADANLVYDSIIQQLHSLCGKSRIKTDLIYTIGWHVMFKSDINILLKMYRDSNH